MIDKFGLCTRHLHDFISREKNSKTKATVQGKLNKLLDAQVILRSAFLKDVLTPAVKVFSLVTQKEDSNIIETVESVEKTEKDYKKLLKKFEQNQDSVFELTTVKAVIAEIEGNDDMDGEHLVSWLSLSSNATRIVIGLMLIMRVRMGTQTSI